MSVGSVAAAMRGRPRLAIVAALGTLAALVPVSVASAAWFARADGGSGSARADALGRSDAPVVQVRRRVVTLRWSPVDLQGGRTADRYTIVRSPADAADDVAAASGVEVACTALVDPTVCSELDVPDGAWRYTVTPRFHDWVGGTSAVSAAVEVTPPTVTLGGVAAGASRRLEGVTLAGFGADEPVSVTVVPETGDGAVEVSAAGFTAGPDGRVTTAFELPASLADGSYHLEVVGAYGPERLRTPAFALDTVAPTAEATPALPEWVNADVTVTLTADDPLPSSGPGAIVWQLATGEPVTVPGASATVPLTRGGALRWHATDAAGNAGPERTLDVRFDGTPPTLGDFGLPATVGNGVVLRNAPTDADSGVANVTYLYCAGESCTPNIPIGGPVAAPYAITWITQPPNGTYRVAVMAVDHAGNVARSEPVTVAVDNVGPVGSLGSLPAVVGATIPLTATAVDDDGVASVTFEYSREGAPWVTIATATTGVEHVYGTVWSSVGLDPGSYEVRAVAADTGGATTVFPSIRVLMYGPSEVTLLNGGGAAGVGQMAKGDKIVVRIAAAPRLIALCPGAWNTSATTLAGSVSVTLTDGGEGHDTVAISSTACGATGGNFGTLTLGSGAYVGPAGAVFSGLGAGASSISWSAATLTLTITLGNLSSGTIAPVTTPTVASYAMSPAAVATNLAAPTGAARTSAPDGVVNF